MVLGTVASSGQTSSCQTAVTCRLPSGTCPRKRVIGLFCGRTDTVGWTPGLCGVHVRVHSVSLKCPCGGVAGAVSGRVKHAHPGAATPPQQRLAPPR